LARPRAKTLALHHRGRLSGRAFKVKIWFVEFDGHIWIGSLDDGRNWVKNLRAASGRVELDLGEGAVPYLCTPAKGEELDRFAGAIRKKHPILGRLFAALVRGERCAFKAVKEG